jgi:DNA-binding NtrC family response regulator
LAHSFLLKAAKKYTKPHLRISEGAAQALKSYSWPGNVRELSHVMERAHILCQGSTLQLSDLGLNNISVSDNKPIGSTHVDYEASRSLDEIELDIIDKRLKYFEGDVLKAAKSLGLSRSAFYRRMGKSKD